MRPQFQKVLPDSNSSLTVLDVRQSAFDPGWHFHPEYELTWIRRGVGDRLVGENMGIFAQDDLVLVGSGVPHFWRSRDSVDEGDPCREQKDRQPDAHALVVQFPAAVFEALPDFRTIRDWLREAGAGMHFQSNSARVRSVLDELPGFLEESGWRRLLMLVKTLAVLAEADGAGEGKRLAGKTRPTGRRDTLAVSGQARINRAIAFVFANARESSLRMDEVARETGMTRSAFSRFFMRMTGRRFSNFVNEVRLSQACEQLMHDPQAGVAEAAFEAGFGTLSNFNRVFREAKGMTPTEFRRRFSGVRRGSRHL